MPFSCCTEGVANISELRQVFVIGDDGRSLKPLKFLIESSSAVLDDIGAGVGVCFAGWPTKATDVGVNRDCWSGGGGGGTLAGICLAMGSDRRFAGIGGGGGGGGVACAGTGADWLLLLMMTGALSLALTRLCF